MKKIAYYIKIYFKIVAQDIKSKMSYRADFIISTIGMLFTNLSEFIAFYILFNNFPAIKGWTYYEILFMYGFTLISLTPVQCLFDNNWNLRSYVYSGDFIKYCFRPINLFFYYQSEVFDIKGIGQLITGIVTLIYCWNKLNIELSFYTMILIVVFLLSSSLFMIAIMNFAAATCFWIVNSGHVMVLAFKFKDYSKYPVKIYGVFFRFIFTFIIPISFISYYPSLIFLTPDDVPALSWLSPLFGGIIFFISYKFWCYGAIKYDGTGS